MDFKEQLEENIKLLEEHKDQYEYGHRLMATTKEHVTDKIARNNIEKQYAQNEKYLGSLYFAIKFMKYALEHQGENMRGTGNNEGFGNVEANFIDADDYNF